MKKTTSTILAFTLGLLAFGSLSALASDEKPREVFININKHNDDNAKVDIKIDGNAHVFDLPDLAEGESKSFTTEDGTQILATRTDKGYQVEVDGKKIEIPMFSGKYGAKLHKSMPLHTLGDDSVTISGVKLDDNQKQIIRDAFLAAGINKEVKFSEKKIMVFSSGDFEIEGDHKTLDWHSKDGGEFEVIVNGDGNEEVMVHKVIKIEKEQD